MSDYISDGYYCKKCCKEFSSEEVDAVNEPYIPADSCKCPKCGELLIYTPSEDEKNVTGGCKSPQNGCC